MKYSRTPQTRFQNTSSYTRVFFSTFFLQNQMDLVQLFEMIDIDNSGAIEQNEFIRPLSRWVRDSKTAPSALIFERVQTGYGEAPVNFLKL